MSLKLTVFGSSYFPVNKDQRVGKLPSVVRRLQEGHAQSPYFCFKLTFPSHQDVAGLEIEVKKLVPVQVVDSRGDVASVLQRVTEREFLCASSERVNIRHGDSRERCQSQGR